MRALALVRLDEMRVDALPELSRDERHRVALARALVTEPGVLLLDEPFDGLDAKGREDMRLELRELVDRLKVTTLLVTHDRIEALTMSDRIGVLCDGALVQEGPPAEVYRKPADLFVANYLGRSNILAGRVVAPDRIKTEIGTLHCPVDRSLGEGDAVTLAVRPENIRLATGVPSDAPNVISGQVEKVVYFGNLLECMVAIGDTLLRVQMHPSDAPLRGARVYLYLPVEHCLAMLG
jgi:iron(III) transport system ATP-binding protein